MATKYYNSWPTDQQVNKLVKQYSKKEVKRVCVVIVRFLDYYSKTFTEEPSGIYGYRMDRLVSAGIAEIKRNKGQKRYVFTNEFKKTRGDNIK